MDRNNEDLLRQLSQQKSWINNSEIKNNKEITAKKQSFNQSMHNHDYTNTEINDISEVKRLKQLFFIYSNNEKTINSQKFSKILIDSNIINNVNFSTQNADILFHKEVKLKAFMNFECFCNVLIKIVKIVFPEEENENMGLNKILMRNLFPLLFKITNTSSNDSFLKKLEIIKNDKSIMNFIEKFFVLFVKLYEKYFSWEFSNIANTRKKDLSEKSLLKFLKEFEMCPDLISKNKVSEIFENLCHHAIPILKLFLENDFPGKFGTSFTIYNFIISLFIVSLISYNDDYEGTTNDLSNLKYLKKIVLDC